MSVNINLGWIASVFIVVFCLVNFSKELRIELKISIFRFVFDFSELHQNFRVGCFYNSIVKANHTVPYRFTLDLTYCNIAQTRVNLKYNLLETSKKGVAQLKKQKKSETQRWTMICDMAKTKRILHLHLATLNIWMGLSLTYFSPPIRIKRISWFTFYRNKGNHCQMLDWLL